MRLDRPLACQFSAARRSAQGSHGDHLPPPALRLERFRRTVLAAMPDIEAIELVDRVFEIGAEVVGTPHPIGIFLAGCRECLGEWELQASQWSRPSSGRGREPIALDQTVCPHGQTAEPEPDGDAQT